MAVYSVDSDAVLSATTAVRGTMERVQGDTHAMLAQLTPLQSSWTGTAAASFHGVIEQWRGVQQQVEESLGAIGGALAVAGLLTALPRARELVKTLYLLPAVISTVAIAFLFVRIYSLEPVGLLNQLLAWVGLDGLQTAWLSNVQTVLAAVSVPEGWRFTGLYMLIIYAALIAVPKELEEAARLDGASWWQTFWRIRFPYIRPVWITTTVMATTFALRGFDIPYLLTNGGPGQASELLTTYMYKTAFVHTDYGYASAISVFIVVECLVAVGLIFLLLRRKDA